MSSNSSSTEPLDIEAAKSALGSRTVTTFTNVASNKSGFGDVVTGWRWPTKDAQQPSLQYCYINKLTGIHPTRIDLARINVGVGPPKSSYTKRAADQAALSQQQWQALIARCRWWSAK